MLPIPVFRVEKNANYTTMSNYHLRDNTISFKAKGILSMFLSLPKNWNYSVSGLAAISKEGKDGILSGLKELEAAGYLEQVRAHARGTLPDVLPKVESASQSVLRDAIRHERRVELALEPDRFYDLVRWGIAKEVLQAAGKNYQDKNALLPLPQTEIDKSNGVLVQNPDY